MPNGVPRLMPGSSAHKGLQENPKLVAGRRSPWPRARPSHLSARPGPGPLGISPPAAFFRDTVTAPRAIAAGPGSAAASPACGRASCSRRRRRGGRCRWGRSSRARGAGERRAAALRGTPSWLSGPAEAAAAAGDWLAAPALKVRRGARGRRLSSSSGGRRPACHGPEFARGAGGSGRAAPPRPHLPPPQPPPRERADRGRGSGRAPPSAAPSPPAPPARPPARRLAGRARSPGLGPRARPPRLGR